MLINSKENGTRIPGNFTVKPIDRPELDNLSCYSYTMLGVILDDLKYELESLNPDSPNLFRVQNEIRFSMRRVRRELSRKQPIIVLPGWNVDPGMPGAIAS